MKREIGSEFWSVPLSDTENNAFPDSVTWFLSGRCALQSIIARTGIRSVSLPSWLCDSMIKPFVDAGVKVTFYPARRPFSQISTEAVLVLDYFGYVRENTLRGYSGIVIRDVTHSIFSAVPAGADYYFGSLRKWAGFWTGGFAWAKDGCPLPCAADDDYGYTALREMAMEQKKAYMCGVAASAGKVFLETFCRAEETLALCGKLPAHERDVRLAKRLDVEGIRKKRRENAARLLREVSEYAIFPTLDEKDCPLFVPILVPGGKRDVLRRHLISRGIYCPVHWPLSEYHTMDHQEKKIYHVELSLVCDQRYTTEDMDYVTSEIKSFWKG